MSEAGWMLAVESATALASVAILQGDRVVVERSGRAGHHHSESLLPLIDATLEEAGCGLRDLGAYAISIGPGAFTSLRIGLATLKGLAFGAAAPVAAVSTLEALAEAALARADVSLPDGGTIVPLLDAQRGEVYVAIHRRRDGQGALECVLPDCVLSPEALAQRLPPDALLVGEGAARFGDAIRAAGAASARLEPGPATPPCAAAVGRVARRLLAAGGGESVDALVPRYLRRAEAEATRLRRAHGSP